MRILPAASDLRPAGVQGSGATPPSAGASVTESADRRGASDLAPDTSAADAVGLGKDSPRALACVPRAAAAVGECAKEAADALAVGVRDVGDRATVMPSFALPARGEAGTACSCACMGAPAG